MPLTLHQRTEKDVPILAVSGEIDAQSLPPLEDRLQELVTAGHHRIVLDFSEVPFIASAGLGVLMSVIAPIQEAGGNLVIAGTQPNVYRIFDLLEFTTLFGFAPSVEAALVSLEVA